jgi:tricorn protease
MPRFSVFLAAALCASGLLAINPKDTRLLAEPAIGADHIAFAYAGDLWTARRDGSEVRRLTTHPGLETDPHFSPDGKRITFTGNYDGNPDVYVVPTEGGVPKRLTWHPGPDIALGFTPDGKSVLFASPREVYTLRYRQLYTVPVEGGWPTKLPVPNAFKASYSTDGTVLAYVPLSEAFNQWKHYRGGTHSRILLFDLKSYATEQVPQPAGRCNDTDPLWIGATLYFRSDRDGEFNLYAFDRTTKAIRRLTQHKDFPVLGADAGGGRLLYEQAGYLHLLDPAAGGASRLKIGVATDLQELRPRFAKGGRFLRGGSLSPSGNRLAIEFRGEILTVPREKGDDRNLTHSPAVHDRTPAWSPDGKSIAWFSDQGGEYGLHIGPQDGKGAARRIGLKGAGFYESLKWSPDGKYLSYTDNSRAVWIADAATGAQTRVDADPLYGPVKVLHHNWSPDSRWLAYTRNNRTYTNRIWLYSLEQKKSFPVTDGLSDATDPVFDAGGKYLYFIASTNAGPVADWFSQARADMRSTDNLYLVVLAADQPSPLQKESDEEGAKADKPKEEAKSPVAVRIDLDGLSRRILAMPPKSGGILDLAAGPAGQVFYRRTPAGEPSLDSPLLRYDLNKRKEDTLLEKADGFQLSRDGKRILVRVGPAWSLCDVADKLDLSKFKINPDGIQVKVDPPAEWKQIFHEAWRINRDYFYDPNFHGADWNAMRAKYEGFLAEVPTRRDLTRVMQWLFSELAVGHHRMFGGDALPGPEPIPGGLLGADYEVANGRYRFRKVFGGLNWTPDLRSPLTEPGVDVKAGEYLLAVEGADLKPPEDLHARFERSAGRSLEITVGPNPDGSGARTVKVVPLENEYALRNRDWVEGNLRKVTEATQGRVAYVYVPNTAGDGHTYFKRYFYPQADREAIIVDERHNGGGSVADYYIDILRRPPIAHWAMRYGADLPTPNAAIQGPKVMLIDETAGSGGDLLPWMFRKFKLGPLVGKRTWGGLVGILGFPVLMDGGGVTAPNLAIWTEDGFIVENEGVPPDVEVEQTPADVIAGRDPQLEKAIQVVMKELEKNPPKKAVRPPFPIRVKKPN